MKIQKWDLIIESESHSKGINFSELKRYRDLIGLFVKRDFIALYKQTILGPIWIVLQPILTTITFVIVFNRIARIDNGATPFLFIMVGSIAWTYFADCVNKTSETFIGNQNLFGKVYFPRLIVPLSIVITNLIKFGFQFGLFVLIYLYYLFLVPEISMSISWHILLLPVCILTMAIFGMGIGLIISSLTTKYRDLRFLIQFGISLAMFVTPVAYPLSLFPEKYQWILQLNPMSPIIETMRSAFLGSEINTFSWFYFGLSFLISFSILLIGVRLFGKVEKSFMDTI